MLQLPKTIIIGNKLYHNLNIGKVIDENFDNIIRCNMSLPMGPNGKKFGSLALCNHLYKNLIKNKISRELFKKKYHMYKNDDINYFFKYFNPKKFDKCFYANSLTKTKKFNKYLKSINTKAAVFKKQCRTGYAVCMQELIDGNSSIFISHFSINEKESRESSYIKKGKGESHLHDSKSEVQVLRWLHKNNKVDASLCLLKDDKNIEFIEDELKPTLFIKEILEKAYYEKNNSIKDR